MLRINPEDLGNVSSSTRKQIEKANEEMKRGVGGRSEHVQQQIDAALSGKKPAKTAKTPGQSRHGINRVQWNGEWFDSRDELKRWKELELLQAAGEISGLKRQVIFHITIGGVEVRYPKSNRHMFYKADHVYTEKATGELVVEDVKMGSGYVTDVYPIKEALMLAMGHKIKRFAYPTKRSK